MVVSGFVALVWASGGCGDNASSDATSASATQETAPSGTMPSTTDTPTTEAPTTSDTTGTGTGTGTDTSDPTTDNPTTETPTTTTETTDTTAADPSVCGNGVVEDGEACDDGNQVGGDGCEPDCQIGEVLCGNGVLDRGETCDDGNQASDDGCSASCVTECGFLCLEAGSLCLSGFHAVQCASPGPPFGQASPIANTCQLATLSVDGTYIALSPETTIDGQPRHLDAMYTDPSNAVFGFAGNTEDIAAGSRLVEVNTATGELTPVGPDLGVWIMGAAMNDGAELWVTVFDTYERNQTTEVRIARVSPATGEIIDGPTVLTEGGMPVTVWSTHVSDVAFRFDGAMFISANEPGPPPPEPLSRYLEVDRTTATVVSAVDGPDDIYAAGIVFVGEDQQIVAMDIRGADDIFLLDLSDPPTLNRMLLYLDPIETNSGTADLAGCSKLQPQ